MASRVLFRLLLTYFCLFRATASPSTRQKRSLVNFNQVVRCAMDGNPIFAFSDYGCFCLGSGSGADQPVDDIDRCCMSHDHCYDMLVDRLICTRLTRYVDSYDWECVKDDLDHDASYAPFLEAIRNMFNGTAWSGPKKFPVCKASKGLCGISLCYCDIQAAFCFAKYKMPTAMAKCPDQKIDEKSI